MVLLGDVPLASIRSSSQSEARTQSPPPKNGPTCAERESLVLSADHARRREGDELRRRREGTKEGVVRSYLVAHHLANTLPFGGLPNIIRAKAEVRITSRGCPR
jgi:hypothetical protein